MAETEREIKDDANIVAEKEGKTIKIQGIKKRKEGVSVAKKWNNLCD